MMKGPVRKLAIGALAAMLAAASPLLCAQDWTPKNQAGVVMVGHSLIGFDMPAMVEGMAISKGIGYTRATQVLIGSPLLLNLQICRGILTLEQILDGKFKYACTAIETESPAVPYDTLVLTNNNQGIVDFPELDVAVADFVDVLHSRNPSGRVLLFTTWEGTSWPGYGVNWPARQAADLATYETIARNSTAVARSRGRNITVEVIPVNIALRDLIYKAENGEVPGVTSRNQIFADDVHMSALGNYFVACVVFSAIMNRTPEGATGKIVASDGGVFIDLPTSTAAALQQIAWTTLSTYRSSIATIAPKAPGSFTVQ
jgi:hypothetical protein